MRKTQQNPPWSDRIAKKYCDQIRDVARKNDLPEPLLNEHCEISNELGVGSYGAVYGTNSDDCIFKITTDSTEAHFCALAIKLRKEKGVDPAGIVDIRAVFALPEKHDDLPVFILWRERAISVGLHEGDECQDNRTLLEFGDRLMAFYEMAEKVFMAANKKMNSMTEGDYWNWLHAEVDVSNAILDDKAPRSTTAFAKNLTECWYLAGDIERLDVSREVGATIKEYMEQGVLIADLHTSNVGIVDRGKCTGRLQVIVDPGHCLILRREFSKVDIKLLR